MSFDKATLDRLLELKRPESVEIENRIYTPLTLSAVKRPEPAALKLHTLTGLVDYVEKNPDALSNDKFFIHVLGHDEVNILGELLPPWQQRNNYLGVTLIEKKQFAFGVFHEVDKFIIELQTQFVQDEVIKGICAFVGNITSEAVRTIIDDGVSQEVEVRDKIGKSTKWVPNHITLKPFRTFPEVEQPAGRFFLRMKKGNDLPLCALFESDGGNWKLEAIQSIKRWIMERLPQVTIIA